MSQLLIKLWFNSIISQCNKFEKCDLLWNASLLISPKHRVKGTKDPHHSFFHVMNDSLNRLNTRYKGNKNCSSFYECKACNLQVIFIGFAVTALRGLWTSTPRPLCCLLPPVVSFVQLIQWAGQWELQRLGWGWQWPLVPIAPQE